MATSTQWNLEISTETDEELRQFLKSPGPIEPQSLAHFVEQAVHDWIFQEAARRAKDANSHLTEEQIMQAVDESLLWAKSQK